jgi:hypothetical protein
MNATFQHVTRPAPAILRVAAVRWLTAELIPFGCLAIGFMIARAWVPLGFAGYGLAVFGSWALCVIYFYRVLGAAGEWIAALFPLIIGNVWVGAVTIVGSATGGKRGQPHVKIIATSSWWIATACLAVVLAVAIMGATLNGERWTRQRNRDDLPGSESGSYPRTRGNLARLWLPGDLG